jgi:glycine/D-amino acid oxidase-like deaminating enzyme
MRAPRGGQARRFAKGWPVTGLLRQGARVTGVDTTQGPLAAGLVVSAQNMWSHELARWTGIAVPLTPMRTR